MKKISTQPKWKIFLLIIATAIILMMAGFYIYTLDYYRASSEVADYVSATSLFIETKDNLTIIHADESNRTGDGIIFYPGGKVEANAYLPLLIKLAEEGYTTVLVEMPFNLAVFGINSAEKVPAEVKEVERWSVLGHSLGGAMASSHMEENFSAYKTLILLGAYPINDAQVPTLAIYGTYDLMLDLTKVADADKVEEIVDGNHANFGNYGEQEGDGTALISREDQQNQAVELIIDFIASN